VFSIDRRLFVGALSAAAVSAALLAAPAQAQQKQVWKASDVHPAGYPNVVAIENMGKKLEKETNGRISIQMYHSMQLGGEK
jgi:TRAP-type C4-dicarboxylate transport system substrate-binding protein